MSQYFPKPNEPFGWDINNKVDLSNYATKAHTKNISYVDTSSFELESKLVSLKTEVDKVDIDKLVPVPVDLSKLSDVVKKTAYDKLVAKVNSIDASAFVLKTKYETDKSKIENKNPDKKTDYNTKIAKIEGEVPNVRNLVTKATLTTIDNKIPSVSSLAKKTDYNAKITEIENRLNNHNHEKYMTTPEFNTVAADVFNARLARANLVAKTNFDSSVLILNNKIVANKTKNECIKNELKKLKTLILLARVILEKMTHKII